MYDVCISVYLQVEENPALGQMYGIPQHSISIYPLSMYLSILYLCIYLQVEEHPALGQMYGIPQHSISIYPLSMYLSFYLSIYLSIYISTLYLCLSTGRREPCSRSDVWYTPTLWPVLCHGLSPYYGRTYVRLVLYLSAQ